MADIPVFTPRTGLRNVQSPLSRSESRFSSSFSSHFRLPMQTPMHSIRLPFPEQHPVNNERLAAATLRGLNLTQPPAPPLRDHQELSSPPSAFASRLLPDRTESPVPGTLGFSNTLGLREGTPSSGCPSSLSSFSSIANFPRQAEPRSHSRAPQRVDNSDPRDSQLSIRLRIKLDLNSSGPWQYFGCREAGTLSDTARMYQQQHGKTYLIKVLNLRHPHRLPACVARAVAAELRVHFLSRGTHWDIWLHSSPKLDRVFWRSGSACYIVKEFCPLTLEQYHGKLSPEALRLVIAEMVIGIKYLHHAGIIHTDIQPKNIFVGEDGRCRIANFDHAKFIAPDSCLVVDQEYEPLMHTSFNESQLVQTTVVYRNKFSAPEMSAKHLGRFAFGPLADYWSLGATIFSLVVDRWDVANDSREDLVLDNVETYMTGFDTGRDPHLIDLVQKLCSDVPDRISGYTVMEHPYFLHQSELFWNNVIARRHPALSVSEDQAAPMASLQWPKGNLSEAPYPDTRREDLFLREALERHGICHSIPYNDSFASTPIHSP
ncbi:hypothetical protein HGRIS_004796 [Hohenbuehelia grisea]